MSSRAILFSAVFLAAALSGCKKEIVKEDVLGVASKEAAQVTLSHSGFELDQQDLHTSGEDHYTSGLINYKMNGKVIASVDFGDGASDDIATRSQNGSEEEFSLKKSDGDKFTKVIIEPLVKTEDCDYIVSGIIKFYSIASSEWLATIDFGDGTCDEWATKVWADGSTTFSMDK